MAGGPEASLMKDCLLPSMYMELKQEEVTFQTPDRVDIHAFIARPKADGRYPAIMVIQEIWGLNDQIRGVARRYAQQGFVAFAPHLFSRYGAVLGEANVKKAMGPVFSIPREKRSDSSTLQSLMTRMSDTEKEVVKILFVERQSLEEKMAKDVGSCYQYFSNLPYIKADKLGVTGFCMGGGIAFQVSTQHSFEASVIFYGANPKSLDAIAKIRGPVLAIYAGEDAMVNAGICNMVEAMIKYKKTFALKVYEGCQHAFFNETSALYDKVAAEDAWQLAIAHFHRYLQAQGG